MSPYKRFAVYFAPPAESSLGRFGNMWLGHDPESGQPVEPSSLDDEAIQTRQQVIAAPSRYGFHGTLKPPFALADPYNLATLENALERLARSFDALVIPALQLKTIGRFIALVPAELSPSLQRLSETCVRDLDIFRLPESPAERQKRLKPGMTSKQIDYLERWGYPYVMSEFRFHLTLTGSLEDDLLEKAFQTLNRLTADMINEPVSINTIALFGDPGDNKPFRLIKRFPCS